MRCMLTWHMLLCYHSLLCRIYWAFVPSQCINRIMHSLTSRALCSANRVSFCFCFVLFFCFFFLTKMSPMACVGYSRRALFSAQETNCWRLMMWILLTRRAGWPLLPLPCPVNRSSQRLINYITLPSCLERHLLLVAVGHAVMAMEQPYCF